MKKALSILLGLFLLFALLGCPGAGGGGSDPIIDEEEDDVAGGLTVDEQGNVYLQKLNCLPGYTYTSGNFTDFGDQMTAPVQAGGSWLIWGSPISKTDTITMKAWMTFKDGSKQNGVGFLAQNGESCIAYSAGMQVGVKNVNVAGCTDFFTDKGNGYVYPDGSNTNGEFLNKHLNEELIVSVTLDGEQMLFEFYNLDGDLLAYKGVAWNAHWRPDAKLYLGVGGFQTSTIDIRRVRIIQDGKTYTVNKVVDLAVSALELGANSTRVSVGGTQTIKAKAIKAGGKATSVLAVSSDTSVATVSVGKPNADGESDLVINGIKSGETTITVTNKSDTDLVKTITVYVDAYSAGDDYGLGTDTTYVYPAPGSSNVHLDGWFRITFDEPPTMKDGGVVNVYRASDNVVVDTVQFVGETINAWDGVNLDCDQQMTYVDGNDFKFMLHYDKLEPSTEYFIAIPMNSIVGKLNGKAFEEAGFAPTTKSWKFTTKAAADISDKVISVDAAEGTTADFRSIQGALLAIDDSADPTGTYKLTLKAGDYNGLTYYKGKANVTIEGEVLDGEYGSDVHVHWFNGEKMNTGTHMRPAFYWGGGSNLVLKNITIKNDYDRAIYAGDAQAEAIYFANGTDTATGLAKATFAAYNCSFKSYQDTIQTTGKAWFYKCYVSGDVDFLWGTAEVALFEECKLVSALDPARGATSEQDLIVARTGITNGAQIGKGFVVFNSEIEIEKGVTLNLGRCAGTGSFYDQAAIVDTKFTGDGKLSTELWDTSVYLSMANAYEHVGWKVKNLTDADGSSISTAKIPAKTSVIKDAIYSAEYSNRNQILNRVFVTASKSYTDSNNNWDLSSYYAEFGITD